MTSVSQAVLTLGPAGCLLSRICCFIRNACSSSAESSASRWMGCQTNRQLYLVLWSPCSKNAERWATSQANQTGLSPTLRVTGRAITSSKESSGFMDVMFSYKIPIFFSESQPAGLKQHHIHNMTAKHCLLLFSLFPSYANSTASSSWVNTHMNTASRSTTKAGASKGNPYIRCPRYLYSRSMFFSSFTDV